MKLLSPLVLMALIPMVASCKESPEDIKSSASGAVITTMTARATGGGSPFDGSVDQVSDLDDLVETAWGDGAMGLHRGHVTILRVLEAYLGISHEQMHIFMEQSDLNLAGVCKALGFDPENLVDTLTASFTPYIEQGVANGVISEDEAIAWKERVREAFSRRVYWTG